MEELAKENAKKDITADSDLDFEPGEPEPEQYIPGTISPEAKATIDREIAAKSAAEALGQFTCAHPGGELGKRCRHCQLMVEAT